MAVGHKGLVTTGGGVLVTPGDPGAGPLTLIRCVAASVTLTGGKRSITTHQVAEEETQEEEEEEITLTLTAVPPHHQMTLI